MATDPPSDVAALILHLERHVGASAGSLPEEVFLFISRITPLVNVDLLIQDGAGRTLLTWREDMFFGAGWHVPGGIIRHRETAADRIEACAREELGATVAFDPAPLLVSETIRPQANRGHFISLLYRCRLLSALDLARRAGTNAPGTGEWRWHDNCPPDLLDVQRPYARFL